MADRRETDVDTERFVEDVDDLGDPNEEGISVEEKQRRQDARERRNQ